MSENNGTEPLEIEKVEVRPFKIVGQLIGAVYDQEGEIVGERVIGEVALYPRHFGEVEELVAKAMEAAKQEGAL